MIETGLDDKVVIITGAAAGIGAATARRFAAEGCRVALWDLDAEAGRALAAELAGEGDRAVFHAVDVADPAAVDVAVAAVVERWERLDVMVANAGIVRDAQLVKWRGDALVDRLSDEVFAQVIDVNLRGVFHCGRAAAPHMIEAGGGVILAASSVVALYGNFGQTNYAATKAGVIAMVKSWARELGRYGIRANAVAPGFTATEILRSMPTKVLEGMVAHTPIGRMGRPEDIAEAYLWLASDAASFVTGTVLSVDGGLVVGT